MTPKLSHLVSNIFKPSNPQVVFLHIFPTKKTMAVFQELLRVDEDVLGIGFQRVDPGEDLAGHRVFQQRQMSQFWPNICV